MFTGIVQGFGTIAELERTPGRASFTLAVDEELSLDALGEGASVAVDGVCLTAVRIDGQRVRFEVIGETLVRSTLDGLADGRRVNVERSAAFGDEIGGHLVSGHVSAVARIVGIEQPTDNHVVRLEVPAEHLRFIFPKGYVALDGASLTVVDVDRTQSTFTVHLIPETLRRTTFGWKGAGDSVNLEVDPQTVAVVETIERVMAERLKTEG